MSAPAPVPDTVQQVAFVVEDLDASMRSYADVLGVAPWNGWELGPGILQGMEYHGEPAEFSFRHALGWSGGVQLELVQPLTGPSIFADHLDEHGPGLHHVGMYVPDHAERVQAFVDAGHRILQRAHGFGADGDGAFCYFEVGGGIPAIVELISAPKVRRPAHFTYPAATA